MTARDPSDTRPVSFAFVSCQNANQGAQNAYRRMIFEDERAPEAERLCFVLHLGDFIYEIVWYPEDRPQGMYDRRLRDIVRYESGEKIQDFHIPTTLDDYRAIYRAYLHDPDLQDARARWPFVNMWDNHEFSPQSESRMRIGYSVPDFSPVVRESSYPCLHSLGSSSNASRTDSVWRDRRTGDFIQLSLYI